MTLLPRPAIDDTMKTRAVDAIKSIDTAALQRFNPNGSKGVFGERAPTHAFTKCGRSSVAFHVSPRTN